MTSEEKAVQAVELRIRQFFDLLNLQEFKQCYQMVDPKSRETLTLEQYTDSAKRFMQQVGKIEFIKTNLIAHINEKTNLYEDKDFVVGITTCKVKDKEITVKEAWIKRTSWHTKASGFIWVD